MVNQTIHCPLLIISPTLDASVRKLSQHFPDCFVHLTDRKGDRVEQITPFFGELLRGEETAHTLKQLFPEWEIIPHPQKALFFKDNQFHPFGGRVKSPSMVTAHEAFFMESLFEYRQDEVVLNEPEKLFCQRPLSLSYQEEQGRWALALQDGPTLLANFLIFADHIEAFLNLLSIEERAKWGEITLASPKEAIHLHFTFKEAAFEHKETLFLTQCLSQERGHFIGRFLTPKEAIFFCFLNDDERDPESISKKIRLLKRTLRKAIPKTAKVLSEKVTLTKELDPLLFDEIGFQNIGRHVQNLSFVGPFSPIKTDFMNSDVISKIKISRSLRNLLSLEQARYAVEASKY